MISRDLEETGRGFSRSFLAKTGRCRGEASRDGSGCGKVLVRKHPCRFMPMSQTTSPLSGGVWYVAEYDLLHSRRRPSLHSGPDSAFLRIMTSENGGLREKRYNRGCSGLGCTTFPTGDFWRGIIASPDVKPGRAPIPERARVPYPKGRAGTIRARIPDQRISGCHFPWHWNPRRFWESDCCPKGSKSSRRMPEAFFETGVRSG